MEKIDELEQTLFELRGEIGAGRHLPPGTRVLCLKDNPAQQWEDLSKAAMDRLKSENKALLKRLKDLEDSGARSTGENASKEDLVPRESYVVVAEEKTKLEHELKQKEKSLLRLKEVRPGLYEHVCRIVTAPAGVPLEELRVPRGDRVDHRFEARVLPERPGARHVAVRPDVRVRLPAQPRRHEDAAGRAGRGRPRGVAAAEALLGRAGAVHSRVPREHHARLLREEDGEGARTAYLEV